MKLDAIYILVLLILLKILLFQAQTVLINGTAFQIVTPVNLVSGNVNVNSSSAPANSTPAQQFTGASSNGSSSVYISGATSPQVVTVQGVSANGNQVRFIKVASSVN